jgi:hypothetical protein
MCGEVYHDAQIFRNEHWRVLCSVRPVANLLKLGWGRLLIFGVGMWIMLRDPEGLLRFSWLETIPQAGVRSARMLRISPVAPADASARKQSDALLQPDVQPDVGLLRDGCKL